MNTQNATRLIESRISEATVEKHAFTMIFFLNRRVDAIPEALLKLTEEIFGDLGDRVGLRSSQSGDVLRSCVDYDDTSQMVWRGFHQIRMEFAPADDEEAEKLLQEIFSENFEGVSASDYRAFRSMVTRSQLADYK